MQHGKNHYTLPAYPIFKVQAERLGARVVDWRSRSATAMPPISPNCLVTCGSRPSCRSSNPMIQDTQDNIVLTGEPRGFFQREGCIGPFTAYGPKGVRPGFYGDDCCELPVDPDGSLYESKVVYFTMRRGQFAIFWSTLVHGSLPHLGRHRIRREATRGGPFQAA